MFVIPFGFSWGWLKNNKVPVPKERPPEKVQSPPMITLKDHYVTFNIELARREFREGNGLAFAIYTIFRHTGRKRVMVSDSVNVATRLTVESKTKVIRAIKSLVSRGWMKEVAGFYYFKSQRKILADASITSFLAGEYRGENDAVAFIASRIIGTTERGMYRSRLKLPEANHPTDVFGRKIERGDFSCSMVQKLLGLKTRMQASRLVTRCHVRGFLGKKRQWKPVSVDAIATIKRSWPALMAHMYCRRGKYFRRLPLNLKFPLLEVRPRRVG
jgi:hypothetical protein